MPDDPVNHEAAPDSRAETPETAVSDSGSPATLTPDERSEAMTLLGTVFFVAACGLIYELLLATISSYLLGSSVTQFSLCIGVFIGSMGGGSYLSQFVSRDLLRVFLAVEIALAAVGGISAWLLFGAYAYLGGGYWAVLLVTLGAIGGLTGIELPLLTRLLSRYGALKTTIAQALSFDYVGALIGSLAFPLVLLPTLGATRTAFLVGIANLGVAAYNLHVFRHRLHRVSAPLVLVALLASALLAGLLFADQATAFFERRLYEDQILFTKQTRYQRIVITRDRSDLRLYLDGNLQFSSSDEYRYHESLVHPAMAFSASRRDVLILGGGDGLGIREVRRWKDVERITLVDIDPDMTRLARRYPSLVAQNEGAFEDPRVRVIHQDAFTFLAADTDSHDVIIADLPDPNNENLAKLYSVEFYKMIRQRLSRGGLMVAQATSPLFSRDAFWCVQKSVADAGFSTRPYHVYVPSFGDWGFILGAADRKAPELTQLPALPFATRYLGSASPLSLTAFDNDTSPTVVEPSTLEFPRILGYYERGVKKWE